MPQFMAGRCVERTDMAVAGREIEDAADGDRRGQGAAAIIDVMRPGQPQPCDIALVDLCQRAVVIFVDAAIARPVAAVAAHFARRCASGQKREQGEGKQTHHPPIVRSEGQKRWRSAFLLTFPMTVRPMSSTIS